MSTQSFCMWYRLLKKIRHGSSGSRSLLARSKRVWTTFHEYVAVLGHYQRLIFEHSFLCGSQIRLYLITYRIAFLYPKGFYSIYSKMVSLLSCEAYVCLLCLKWSCLDYYIYLFTNSSSSTIFSNNINYLYIEFANDIWVSTHSSCVEYQHWR